jgi:hypothetical protein
MKKQPAPLIIEQHPKDYTGFPFITLIQYHKTPLLCVVDNADDNTIRAFVLDMCGPTGISEEMVVMAAQEWFEKHAEKYPISIHFSKLGINTHTAKIYRTINIEFVSRAIGPVPKYPMTTTKSVKRRRRKPLSPTIEIHNNTVGLVRN